MIIRYDHSKVSVLTLMKIDCRTWKACILRTLTPKITYQMTSLLVRCTIMLYNLHWYVISLS